jgi:hypothetical protein
MSLGDARSALRRLAVAALVAATVAGCGGTGEVVPAAASAPALPTARPSLMVPVAADAAGLARRITEGESGARNPLSTGPQVRAGGEVAQVAYRQLGRRPGWDAEVLAAVPAGLRPVVRHNLAARGFHLQFPPTVADPMTDDWGTDA